MGTLQRDAEIATSADHMGCVETSQKIPPVTHRVKRLTSSCGCISQHSNNIAHYTVTLFLASSKILLMHMYMYIQFARGLLVVTLLILYAISLPNTIERQWTACDKINMPLTYMYVGGTCTMKCYG